MTALPEAERERIREVLKSDPELLRAVREAAEVLDARVVGLYPASVGASVAPSEQENRL